ncbi:MAG: sigma-54 dependent transcriptional regulator [Thermodesulfobacteriota bacterium]|nr:sigma-54 dependent transcriptional regulator [Thermodesulfobacteriota bacterium]
MSEQTGKILIVDDEQNMRIALFEALSRNGYEVAVSENGRTALEMVKKNLPDVVIADIKMPEMDGIELLNRLKKQHPDLPVVIITGYAAVDTAVKAMKQGAFDYIIKPFPLEVIKNTVARIFSSIVPLHAISVTGPYGKRPNKSVFRPIIGNDQKMLALMERAKAVASSKATVLILGETGTGKEIISRYIHEQSDRRDGPFVALNCAALPETLLESELFGHEKGAFTGAIATKKGKFELADKGTLLLDEISEIPLHLQAKLLRVIQEEEVDRLGGKAPVKIDVHLLATTNCCIEEAVKNGTFRQDLFYRINVIQLCLPPLREKPGDIEMLADYFIEKFSVQYSKDKKEISQVSLERFLKYSWPGNIREMENLIERGVLLSVGDKLEPWDFWDDCDPAGLESGSEEAVTALDRTPAVLRNSEELVVNRGMTSLKEVERQMILQALQETDNNRTHAARMLGISVRTLRNKLHEYRSRGYIE